VGDDRFYLKFWAKLTCWSENADFQSTFARSSKAVTPSYCSEIFYEKAQETVKNILMFNYGEVCHPGFGRIWILPIPLIMI